MLARFFAIAVERVFEVESVIRREVMKSLAVAGKNEV